MTVLVVEDQAIIRMNTARLLSREGYSVLEAGTGVQAIAAVQANRAVDVVLMDIDLGAHSIDGIEAAAEIYERWGIPVVFYSAHVDRETIERTRTVKRYGYVQKSPGHEQYLLATLEMAIRLRTAERESLAAQRRMQAVFDTVQDNILIHEIDENGLPGRYVAVNRSTCETLGYSEQELLRLSPNDTSDPTVYDTEGAREIMDSLRYDGQARFEMWGRSKDGRSIPFEIRSALIEEEGRHLVVGISRDMSESYAQRRELRQTNEILERLFELRFVNIAILDRSYRYLRVNSGYARSAALPKEQILGRSHFELYPDEENQRMFDRVLATGTPETISDMPFEFPEQPERGTTYWDVTMYPTFDDDEAVDGLVLVLVETTERRRAAEEARQIQEQYRTVADHSVDIVAVYDAEMNIRYVSPSSVSQTGWTGQELRGSDVFSLVHPEDRERLLTEIGDARACGRDDYENVYRLRCKDGSYCWVESRTDCVRNGDGKIAEIIVTTHVIDEDVQFYRDLGRVIASAGDETRRAIAGVVDSHPRLRTISERIDR